MSRRCTGVAASWCPVHGDCTCPRTDDGEPVERHVPCVVSFHGYPVDSERIEVVEDPACPLHALASSHGDDL